MSSPLPAHQTKHIHQLEYPFKNNLFYLSQLDNGLTNGTGLWLGAQCLSVYLADTYGRKPPQSPPNARPRAIELGSGIGLSALALSSLGWDILATDLPDVLSSVLSQNITRNIPSLPPGSGSIQARVLDWTVPPENWTWKSNMVIASQESRVAHPLQPAQDPPPFAPPFNLIISADTLYLPSLTEPLLRTLHALSIQTLHESPSNRAPPIFLCVERRDPILMDRTLSDARDNWNFAVERIPHKKVAKAMEKGGLRWPKDEWEGIELWKLSLRVT